MGTPISCPTSSDADLTCDSEEESRTGQTFGGQPITGTDFVRMVGAGEALHEALDALATVARWDEFASRRESGGRRRRLNGTGP